MAALIQAQNALQAQLAALSDQMNVFERTMDKRLTRLERRVDLKPRNPLSVIQAQMICSYLSFSDMAVSARVSKQWKEKVDSPLTFRVLMKERFPVAFASILERDAQSQQLTRWKLELQMTIIHTKTQKLEIESAHTQARHHADGQTLDTAVAIAIHVTTISSIIALGAGSTPGNGDLALQDINIRW